MATEIDIKELCRQLEFYFSDSNLPYDKFFQPFLANKDGWVPLSEFLKFNGVKKLGVKEASDLITAIKKSDGLIELNEDQTSVKRVSPMPTPQDKLERLERTLFFTLTPSTDIPFGDLKTFFAEFGQILLFKLNRPSKKSAGSRSGVVEFATLDSAAKAKQSEGKLPFEGDVNYAVQSLKSAEEEKTAREDALYLKNYAADKVFEVHGLADGIKFFDLRKIISPLIWPSSAEPEKAAVSGEKGENNDENEEKIAKKPKIEKNDGKNDQNDDKNDSKNAENAQKDDKNAENNQNDGKNSEKDDKNVENNQNDDKNDSKNAENAQNDDKNAENNQNDGKNDQNGDKNDKNNNKNDKNDGKNAENNQNDDKPPKKTPEKPKNYVDSQVLRKSKSVLFGDVFNDGQQFGTETKTAYAVVRIDAKSDLTAEKVKKVVENSEMAGELKIVVLPQNEARRKWIKGVKRFEELKKGLKSGRKRRR